MATNGADLQGWIRERLFDAVPIAVAIIDAQLNVVQANEAFERMFGPWRSRRCHAVYKDRETPCEQCAAFATFEDGATRVTEETGIDRTGRRTQYIKHTFPIRSADGTIPYLVEMSTDVSEFERMRRPVPVVEIGDQGHLGGIGRPNREPGTRLAVLFAGMGAEFLPGPVMGPLDQ